MAAGRERSGSPKPEAAACRPGSGDLMLEEVDMSYPIILGFDGRVMDGMHRIARALFEGNTTIRAVRFPAQPEPDFRNCRPSDLPYD